MKRVYGVIIVVLMCLCLTSGGILGLKLWDDRKGLYEYQILRDQVMAVPHMKSPVYEEHINSDLPNVQEEYLKEMNTDYYAWLYLPDAPINYPIVFPDNNQEYLSKSFQGEKYACGSLFFDSAVEPFSSLNTVIHGHNMRSGEMFGELDQYLSSDYLADHKHIYLLRDGEWSTYQIFSVYRIGNSDSWPYQYLFASHSDFSKYIRSCISASVHRSDLETEPAEIITLSTCYGKKEKLIVQAKREVHYR